MKLLTFLQKLPINAEPGSIRWTGRLGTRERKGEGNASYFPKVSHSPKITRTPKPTHMGATTVTSFVALYCSLIKLDSRRHSVGARCS